MTEELHITGLGAAGDGIAPLPDGGTLFVPLALPGETVRAEVQGNRARLLEVLPALTGMVVLSGYPSRLYNQELRDWRRIERRAHADGARPRTEVLWISPRAAERLDGMLPFLEASPP